MTKRQRRISPQSLMEKPFTGNQWLHIIMKSGAVHLVSPMRMDGNQLKVKNTRLRSFVLKIDEIEEIWQDKIDDHT